MCDEEEVAALVCDNGKNIKNKELRNIQIFKNFYIILSLKNRLGNV